MNGTLGHHSVICVDIDLLRLVPRVMHVRIRVQRDAPMHHVSDLGPHYMSYHHSTVSLYTSGYTYILFIYIECMHARRAK